MMPGAFVDDEDQEGWEDVHQVAEWEPFPQSNQRGSDGASYFTRRPGQMMPGAFLDYDERLWWENVDQGAEWVPFSQSDQRGPNAEDEDVIIAVMGVTGAGKSSFIKSVSGRNDVIVGDSLSSETQEVHAYEFFHKGTNYILVDTPGFDDTNRKDSEITEQILTWLKTSLLQGSRLNGVIYLHRICDPRMGGTALRNNRMFTKLCGDQALKNVILATTFWERVTPAVGAKREQDLRSTRDFWGGMIEKGAKMARLTRSRESGLALLEQIATNGKVVLDAQDEMVNQGRSVKDTSVLREEQEALKRMQRQLEAEKEAARVKMELEIERARKEASARLAREQEILRKQREAERVAESRRLAREKRLAQERHEEQLRQAKMERQRQEERRLREQAEMKQRELEEKERQRKREEEALAEVARQRLAYQRNYSCIGHKPRWLCDGCGGNVEKYTHYYHCCFCDTDKYFHCGQCGNDCGEADHPYMVERVSEEDCIVM